MGTADNDALYAVLEFVNKNTVQTADLARVSFVKGDATADPDPHGDRSYQQTLLLCRRFFRLIPNIAMYPMDTTSGSLGRRLEIPLEPPMGAAPTVTATPAAEVTSFNSAANPTLIRLTGNVGAVSNWGVLDNVKIDASI
ncbi:hypothetical protein QE369_002525 [Agrobacterium larrymoorei]|uniref:Uncharacterized protein n=1 Tax=Agrobacterium larrymoorei TaxID=160699 RepID=A0AAJ2B8F6_9HYPH|nr:hypothetical protein [Agrobacterium larrymoorei]MDR6102328.1 hypothetical protein [Agrobacterium larrymoorei]